MPSPRTYLHLPQPCPERWAAMTPAGPGRHCAACQKVVVDFTQKTDAEILAHLARTAGAGCGRFRAEQLARPLQPAASTSHWRSWLASVLAAGGVLGSGRAAGQASGASNPGPVPAVVQPAATAVSVAASNTSGAAAPADGPIVVRGRIVAQDDTLGLPGVTVQLPGTTLGCSTDVNGNFELVLPASAAGATLQFSYVGYVSQQLLLPATSPPPVVIKLQAAILDQPDIVIGGYDARKPWPWHPRRLYQWSKYQLLRPFRR